MAADDVSDIKGSLEEIKAALANKKKDKGQEVTTDIFSDPRFIEIFESYFKPLIDSTKELKDRLLDKKKVSVFDVVGLSEREQTRKRDALTKEIERLTEKLSRIAKNLGNVRNYSITDIIGLTKTEKTNNKRIVNNAVRALSLNIHKMAKNLGDEKVVMRFLGLKPMKMPNVAPLVATPQPTISAPVPPKRTSNRPVILPTPPPPAAPPPKKGGKTPPPPPAAPAPSPAAPTTPPVLPPKPGTVPPPLPTTAPSAPAPAPAPVITTPPPAPVPTLSEKEDEERRVVNVKIVDLSEGVKKFFREIGFGGGGMNDKGKGTGEDREAYSHSANAFMRNLVLGLGLLAGGVAALISGLFDTGPLKGVKKMVASYSLQLAAKLGQAAIHYLENMFPNVVGWVKNLFKGGLKGFTTILEKGITKIGSSFFTAFRAISPKLSNWTAKTILHIAETMEKFGAKLTSFFAGGIAKSIAKPGLRGLLNKAGATALKFLGKAMGKIPFIGALISAGFAMHRFANGDVVGGLIDLASGAASTIPVVGTAAAIALDIWNATRDIQSGGVKQNASKGVNKKIQDFFANTFKKLIYNAIKYLPFADKIAKIIGIDPEGLKSDVENPDTGTSPEISRNQERIKAGIEVKQKATKRQQEILGTRKDVSELNDTERKEYERQTEIIQRADNSIENTRNAIRGLRQKENQPKVTAVEAPPKPETQTAVASVETQPQAGEEAPEPEETPQVEVVPNRPFVMDTPRPVETQNETVVQLKEMNTQLAELNSKTARQSARPQEQQPLTNIVTAVAGGGGNGGTNTFLQTALETVRDTVYTSREKSRGFILDFRSYA